MKPWIPLKFPKYSREQNKNCKLMEEDIAYIQKTYALGLATQKMLAKQFNVHKCTIQRWSTPENYEKHRQWIKNRGTKQYKKGEHWQKYGKKYFKRKLKEMPKVRKYIYVGQWRVMATGERQPCTLTESYRKRHREFTRKSYIRHRKERLAYAKKYNAMKTKLRKEAV